jgi:hypothetical protein
MKKISFLLFLGLIFISSINLSFSCLTSSDDYAVEVLIPSFIADYNLANLKPLNPEISNNAYFFNSQYSGLLTIINQEDNSLSIKLQIPTQKKERTVPYFKLISQLSTKTILNNITLNNWVFECSSDYSSCEFSQPGLIISTQMLSADKYRIEIESQGIDLESCNLCQGLCVYDSGAYCIPNSVIKLSTTLLENLNLIKNTEDLIVNKKLEKGNYQILDIIPIKEMTVDWQQALSQELINLKQKNIINIKDNDIAEISQLAKQGQAGYNKKITFNKDKNGNEKWLYYYDSEFPMLTKIKECRETPQLSITGAVVSSQGANLSLYYLIPILFTAFVILFFIASIIIARIIKKKHNKKLNA